MANGHTKALASSCFVLLVTALLLSPVDRLTAQQPNPVGADYFPRYIQPVFEQKCFSCHTAESSVSKLDLTSREGLMRGGDNGPAIVAGDAERSLLYKSITHQSQPFMPLGMDRLSQQEIDRIAAWINAGAQYGAAPSGGDHQDEKWIKGQKLFSENVQPLFESTCLKCHSSETKASGLDLSTRDAILAGGENGKVVEPGRSKDSKLYKAVAHLGEPHMPFRSERLPQETIDRLAEWIDTGAPFEGKLEASSGVIRSTHWAFQAPRRPDVPQVNNQAWVRNPVDAFVSAKREEKGLEPVAPADKRTLLRRVYLDLVGLPPTQEEMQAFLDDDSPNAYENTVDKLLDSPRYGERWGRHWMDVWRYSDWYGWTEQNQVRYSHRHLWRWRDWIVESLNDDKSYDQMVREMLAGDELDPENEDMVRATGYLARNWYMFNRNVWLQDTVEYTASGFLGITLKCARCHDHKYDPLLQTDYYRFRAFFEPHQIRMDRVPGEPDTMKAGLSRAYDADAGTQTYRFIRGSENNPDEAHPLSPGVPRMFGNPDLKIEPKELPRDIYYPAIREFVHKDLLAKAEKDIEEAERKLAEAEKALTDVKEKLTATNRPEPRLLADGNRAVEAAGSDDVSATSRELLDELRHAEDNVALAEKRVVAARADLPALEARITADKAKYGTLADADADALAATALKKEREARILKAEADMLEARQDLTEALLNPNPEPKDEKDAKEKSAETEGKKDEKKFADEKRIKEAQSKLQAALDALKGPGETYTPIGESYPRTTTGRRTALARWIANKENPLTARVAVNHIWLRHFGEGIVSTMFNFGSSGQPPSNPELLDWLAMEFMDSGWSMKHMHRLMVLSNTYQMRSSAPTESTNRDKDPDNIYLWRMNPRRMEAEAVRDSLLYLSGKLELDMGGEEIAADKGQELFRRSLYFQHTPDTQMTFLRLWDAASPNECFRRSESVTPHQALSLSNSKLSLEMSRTLAGIVNDTVGSSPDSASEFVTNAFDKLLGRLPTDEERGESETYIREQTALYADAGDLKRFETGEKNEKTPPAADPHLRARESFVHVMFNHNDFVTIR
ncbi:MAG: DUF1553 domain-containing protein [Acidobacteria bacterium]|nr:DUF1553 domain-containing protein [Acidobacteriota bacterium]